MPSPHHRTQDERDTAQYALPFVVLLLCCIHCMYYMRVPSARCACTLRSRSDDTATVRELRNMSGASGDALQTRTGNVSEAVDRTSEEFQPDRT